MRYATATERRKILSIANVDQKWLAPNCRPRGRVHRLFPDPGYVLIFESAQWKNCALVVSEPLDAPNIIKEQRYPRIDVHYPAFKEVRLPSGASAKVPAEVQSSGWYSRNVIVVNERLIIFKKKDCTLIAPGLGMPEWRRIFAVCGMLGGAKAFVVLPQEALECGSIRLPGMGNDPRVHFSIGGETYLRIHISLGVRLVWSGIEKITQKAVRRHSLRRPKNK